MQSAAGRRILTCLCGTLAVAWLAAPQAASQTGDIRRVHDPAIIRQGDTYYLFSTNDGIAIRRSTDLFHWERIGRVFEGMTPPWAAAEVPGVRAPWAPDIAYFNGRYHLYYSLSTFGSQRSVIGLATNVTLDPSSPEYRWEDRGKVVESWPGRSDFNAIDPNVAFDENGEPWLAWGSFWGGIKMRKLDPRTGLLSGDDTTTYSLAARPGEGAVEAPFILRRGEYFYLFVSFDFCCRRASSTYNVRVGRSQKITGPYVDRAGVPMLEGGGTLVLASSGRVRGPGHNAVLTEGDTHYLVHHFYDAEENGVSKLQIRPLLWDAEGWPVAGEPITGPVARAAGLSGDPTAGSAGPGTRTVQR